MRLQDVTQLRGELLFLPCQLLHIMLQRFNLALSLGVELFGFELRLHAHLFRLFFSPPHPFLPNLLDGYHGFF